VSGISKEERQFNLILTLIAYPHGIKRDDILSIVPGYHESFDRYAENKNAGVLKNFERDKRDIAALGIVIEKVDENEASGDNQNTRYFIQESEFDFPEDVKFSSEELQLLKSAAMAWRDGSMNLESRKALIKLRSLGLPTDETYVGVAPSMSQIDTTFDVLQVACNDGSLCTFQYLKPGESTPQKRTVLPLTMSNVFGHWHVYTFDTLAEGFRTFLVERIVSTPVVVAGAASVPEADYGAVLLSELDALSLAHHATLALTPGSDASTRLVARYGALDTNDRLTVHFTDTDVLADELCEFGSNVEVLDNDALAEALRRRFAQIAELHGDPHE
jgi:proteasome accessory factor B